MDLLQAIFAGIVANAASPLVFLPALIVGWWARDRRQALIGALAIAFVQLVLSFTVTLPAGAERLWWLEPTLLVAPLGIVFATFALHRWLLRSDAATPASTGPRAVRTVLGFIVGAVAGGLIALLLGWLVIEIGDIHDRESSEAYMLVFVVVPLGMIVGSIAGGVIAWRRAARRAAA